MPQSLAANDPIDGDHSLNQIRNRIANMSVCPISASQIAEIHLLENQNLPSETTRLKRLAFKLGWPSARLLSLSDAGFLAAINEQVVADFDAAQTIQVDGWVMSETEVLCCGLIASWNRSTPA